MRRAALIASGLALVAAGFGVAGCSGDGNDRGGPGIVENKTPQPTTGTAGTKAPTPPGRTTTG